MSIDKYAFEEGMADAELGRQIFEDNPFDAIRQRRKHLSWRHGHAEFTKYHRKREKQEKLDYENELNCFDPTKGAVERELLAGILETMVRIAENNEAFQQAHLDAQKEIDQTLRDMWMELVELRRK